MNCHYHAGHGTQNLTQGLENSCNPFFITIGQRLGVHNYFKYFQGFGFTDITGIDLPGEASPQYYKEKQYGIVELSSASFGQTNSLTPHSGVHRIVCHCQRRHAAEALCGV